jgi:hypothetical protein
VIGPRRVRRDRRGRYRLALSAPERELLRWLPSQAQELLEDGDPSATRLFPPAYPTDEASQAEYAQMAGESLLERHRRALNTMRESVDSEMLDEVEAQGWLDALEVLRLVLGTQLDVAEDMAGVVDDDPAAPGLALYGYLSMLQGEIVDALAGTLPIEGTASG